MSQETYEECLEEELKRAIAAHRSRTEACIDYLKIIDMYSRLIQRAETVEEGRDWAHRMIDHALKVL